MQSIPKVDPFVLSALCSMLAEIEHHTNHPGEITPNDLQRIKNDFDALAAQHPAAYQKANEALATPFYGKGQLLPVSELGFSFPIKELTDCTPEMEQRDKPLGVPVWLVYTHGKLDKAYLGQSSSPIFEDITQRLADLACYVPTKIDAWENGPQQLVTGIISIGIDDWLLLNEIAPRPFLSPVMACANILRDALNDPYARGVLNLTVIGDPLNTYQSLGFSEAQYADVIHEKESRLCYLNGKLVGEIPNRSTLVMGDIKKITWKTHINGYVYPYLKLKQPVGALSEIPVYEFKPFMLKGLQEGGTVTLDVGEQRAPVVIGCGDSNRKLFSPSHCPSCGSMLLYEGNSEYTMFIRCTQSDTCPSQPLRRLLLAEKDSGIFVKASWFLLAKINRMRVLENVSDILNPDNVNHSYPLVNVLKGLGLPGVTGRTAGVIAASIKDLPAWLKDPKVQMASLEMSRLSWSDRFRCLSLLKSEQEVFLTIAESLNIDYTPIALEPPSIGIVGSAKISRWQLQTYFRDCGLQLEEEIKDDTRVVLAGYHSSATTLRRLESRGVMVIDISHCVNIHALIEEVKRYVE